MQEFGSFTTKVDTRSAEDRARNLIQIVIDEQPEEVVDLTALEEGVATLVANSTTSVARLLEMVEQLIDLNTGNELGLRELKKIHFQLADMTDNFIEEVD